MSESRVESSSRRPSPLHLLWPTSGWTLLGVGFAASTLKAGAQLVIPLVLGSIVDEALIDQDPEALRNRALLLVVLAMATFIGHSVYALAFTSLEERGLTTFQIRLLERVNTIPKSIIDTWRSSAIHAFFTEDGPKLARLPGRFLGSAITTLVQLVGLIAILVWRYGAEALLVVALVPLYVLLPVYLSPAIRSTSRSLRDAAALTTARIQDLLRAAREIRIFGQERWAVGTLSPLFESRRKKRLRAELLRSLTWANYALTFLVGAAAYWYGGLLVFEGRLTIGELVALVALLTYLEAPVQSIVELHSELQTIRASMDRLMPLLESPVEPRGGELELSSSEAPTIRFDRVGFTYPGAGARALDDLTFTIPAGAKVGIVGPSGAGKSTLVALLLRLYDATEGRVLLDGHELPAYGVSSLRKRIGYVPQDPVLLPGTVEDNLRLAAPHATDAEIERCCRLAGAREFVENLPSGYQTDLGDQAVRLSGGQRQRIAIARALARRPALMILDEATAALDTVLERALMTTLLPRDAMTTLIVTHRIHAITECDLILVLDGGRLVASGTHRELSRSCGLYARLQTLPEPEDAEVASLETFSTRSLQAP